MFLVNSRLGLFSATPPSLNCKSSHPARHSFSRSYGVNVPSSLTRVLSIALVYSTCLPVSVLVRASNCSLEVFLGSVGSTTSPKTARHHILRFNAPADLPTRALYVLKRGQPTPRWPTLLRHLFSVLAETRAQSDGTGISTGRPSPTLFSLGLGPD